MKRYYGIHFGFVEAGYCGSAFCVKRTDWRSHDLGSKPFELIFNENGESLRLCIALRAYIAVEL